MKRVIVFTVAATALIFATCCFLWWRSRLNEQLEAEARQRRDAWIADTISELQSGTSSVYLYSCVNTKVMLERISGMPEVEEVIFEQTIDLSDDGLNQLMTLPNLRELDFRGESHLSDSNVRLLAGCLSLESLGIKSCNVTDVGLDDIAKIPKLRSFRHAGQFSKPALQELQTTRPDCVISDAGWCD